MSSNGYFPGQSTFMALSTALVGRCQADSVRANDVRTVSHVELERFAGTWYIVANIPSLFDRRACNAVGQIRRRADGSLDTRLTFNKGRFDGSRRQFSAAGLIRDARSNAVWRLRLAGPFGTDFRILHVNADYTEAVVGRNQRDYAGILARSPTIANAHFFEHVRRLRELGYETDRLRLVPQRWPEKAVDNRAGTAVG